MPSSLARRERERTREVVQPLPIVIPQQKAEPAPPPVVLDQRPRARVVFMEVVRDQFGEIAGLRPIYEDS